jgi:hypothetical protein
VAALKAAATGFLGSLMVSRRRTCSSRPSATAARIRVSRSTFGHTAYHGDDSYRRRLEPLLDQPDVRMHGPIAHDAVALAFASIDVLVVPSIWPENSPLVIHEAFLAGVPVVASRIGGIPELVTDGRNGLLFDARDVTDLSRVLVRLLTEPRLLDTLRAGIPEVRSIQDDVRMARELYRRPLATATNATLTRPRVAAIVLNFRTPDDTLLAVKSLLASRRPIDDIIVVDNDPAENARDRLSGVESQISYVLSGRKRGFSGGMNLGIRQALRGRGSRPARQQRRHRAARLRRSSRTVHGHTPRRASRAGGARAIRAGLGSPRSECRAPRTGRMRHRGVGAQMRDGGGWKAVPSTL